MPAIATLTLADTALVDRLFVPANIKGNVATFLDKVSGGGSFNSYAVLTHSHSDPSKTTRNAKTRLKMTIPRINGTTGLVESRCSFDVTFLCDDMSTDVERQDIVTLCQNALASSAGVTIVDNESYF